MDTAGAKMASQRQSERLNLLQLLLAWRACCPIYFAESRKDNLRGKITPLVHLCKYEMIKLYVAYWVIKDLYFMQNCKVGTAIPFKKWAHQEPEGYTRSHSSQGVKARFESRFLWAPQFFKKIPLWKPLHETFINQEHLPENIKILRLAVLGLQAGSEHAVM